ncbi:phenoloxidase-activating factor 1-like isoform X2 [Scylla paramamosain]|uniref:phenoloxidase-activating factor 1-like isoform X2 n=1 Tax=Scylla paramamosain TaxID=85552 RepID=UPI003083E37F
MRWPFWCGVVLVTVMVAVMTAGAGASGGDRHPYRFSAPSHYLRARVVRAAASPTEEVEVNGKENGDSTLNEENGEDTLKEKEEEERSDITKKEEEERGNVTLTDEEREKKEEEKGDTTLKEEKEEGKNKLKEEEKEDTTPTKEREEGKTTQKEEEKENTKLAEEGETGKATLKEEKEKENTLKEEKEKEITRKEEGQEGRTVNTSLTEEEKQKDVGKGDKHGQEHDRHAFMRDEDLLPDTHECGKRSRKSYRVMFGEDAPLNAYPWIALLGYKDPAQPDWLCGGTLINDRYVLSAGHCVHPVSTQRSNAGQLVKIRLGEHNLATDPDCPTDFIDAKECAASPEDYNPEDVIVHEGYNLTNMRNDISLIRLDRAVTVSHSIRPVCLPQTGLDVGKFLGSRDAVVAGWGATENVTQSKILQRAPIPYNSNKKCEKVYFMSLAESQLCFGGRGKQDSCYGDSGGPIMQAKAGTGQYTLLGVVSFGKQICGIPGTPAVYTNVAFYREWIVGHLKP